MLRMIIDDDGQQRILKEVPYFHFIQHDLTNLTQQEQQESLTQIREALSYRVLPTESWPLFEVEISWLNNDCYRLHINLDLLQFDTMSFKILFDDLFNAYSGQELIPQTFTFRDYCLKIKQIVTVMSGKWHGVTGRIYYLIYLLPHIYR